MVEEWASLKEQMLAGDLGPPTVRTMDEIMVALSAVLMAANWVGMLVVELVD